MNRLKITRYLLNCALFFFSVGVFAESQPGVTFVPVGPTTFYLANGDTAVAKYIITNVTTFSRRFHLKNHLRLTPWLTQLTGPGTCVPDEGLNFFIQSGKSCLLALKINGSKVPDTNVFGGPSVCFGFNESTTTCFQPANLNDLLSIKKIRSTARTARVYIANSGDNTVQQCVLNNFGNLGACIAKAVGTAGPNGMTINPTNDTIFVTSRANNRVSGCPLSTTQTIINCSSTGGNNFNQPSAIALDSAGTRAYVTNVGTNTVTICNVSGSNLTGCAQTGSLFNQPNGIVLNPMANVAYVTNGGSNEVKACALSSTGTFISCSSTGSSFDVPYGITLNSSGTMAYVTNAGNSTVTSCTVDTSTGLLGSCVQSNDDFSTPMGIAINNAGRYAYIANNSGNFISKCPFATNGTISTPDCTVSPSQFNQPDGIALLSVLL